LALALAVKMARRSLTSVATRAIARPGVYARYCTRLPLSGGWSIGPFINVHQRPRKQDLPQSKTVVGIFFFRSNAENSVIFFLRPRRELLATGAENPTLVGLFDHFCERISLDARFINIKSNHGSMKEILISQQSDPNHLSVEIFRLNRRWGPSETREKMRRFFHVAH